MAKAKPLPYPIRVKVLRQYWDEERGTYVADVQLPDEEKPARVPTLKQQMVIAIVRGRHSHGVPEGVSIADLTRIVETRWEAECKRRKIEPSPAPKRDAVARALRLASLIP
jgi:hypothetical protein